MINRDRLRRWDIQLLDRLAGQGIDEPRLAAGQLVGVLDRSGTELLAGLGCVLTVEISHLVQSEVPEAQRLQLYVARARRAETVAVASGEDFIVADVT